MALTGFQVVHEEHALDGVVVHAWEGTTLVLALVTRTAIDDAFDRLRPYDPDRKRLTKKEGNALVEANLESFSRIINAKRHRNDHVLMTITGFQRPVIVVTYADVEESGEFLSANILHVPA